MEYDDSEVEIERAPAPDGSEVYTITYQCDLDCEVIAVRGTRAAALATCEELMQSLCCLMGGTFKVRGADTEEIWIDHVSATGETLNAAVYTINQMVVGADAH